MKNIKNIYIGIFLCIFFMYFGILFQSVLAHKIDFILKLDNTNKTSVVVNNTSSMNSFTLSDIAVLKNKLKSEELFAMSEVQEKVTFERRDIDTKIIGVSSNFNQFYNVNITEGSFFNESIEKENKFCAVIEDKLAYKLFGNENVKGLKIKILDHDFKIIGVSKRDSTIIQKISEDGLEQVYIPLETLVKIDKKAEISYLQFKNLDSGTLGKNKDKVTSLLLQVGKCSSQYRIMDYNVEKKVMEQKPFILCFILGVLCILVYAKYLMKTMVKIVRSLKKEIKEDYLLNIIQKNKKSVLKKVAIVVLMIFSIFLLWRWIRFDLYIPPKYIPDELINLSYYEHMIQDGIKESINNRVYLNPFIDLKLIKTNRIINLLFVFTLISILILNSLIKKILQSKDISVVVGYCAKCTIVALLGISIICMGIKMPLIVNIKSLFTIWVFIFTKIIAYNHKSTCEKHAYM